MYAGHRALQGNYVFAGLYINELVYKLCQANQASTELFALYQACIQQLSLRQDLAGVVRTFEYHLQNLLVTAQTTKSCMIAIVHGLALIANVDSNQVHHQKAMHFQEKPC